MSALLDEVKRANEINRSNREVAAQVFQRKLAALTHGIPMEPPRNQLRQVTLKNGKVRLESC